MSAHASSRSRRPLVFAAVLLLLGLAALAVLVAPRRRDAAGTTAAPSALTTTTGSAAKAPALSPPESPTLDATRFETVLADYRRDAVYPPGSRPHDAASAHKLEWNAASSPPVPELADDGLAIRFGADKAHVMAGETYSSWIEVFPSDRPSQRRPVVIREAWITTTSGESIGRIAPLTFRDDGHHRYVNSFRPGDVPRLAERSDAVRLVAMVDVDGRVNQVFRDFTYTPRAVVRVTGVKDSVAQGSLEVTVDVDVLEDGLVTFEANLLGPDGDALVWVDTQKTVKAGHHQIDLVFFGKAIVDKGLSGPFRVQGLHGVFRSIDEAEMPLRWAWPREHVTSAYALAEFSPDPWDAPEKRANIARLEALIKNDGRGDSPTDGDRYVVFTADGKRHEYKDGVEIPPAP